MPSNPAARRIELVWTYTPTDYFAAPVVVEGNCYEIEIGGGSIIIRADADYYESDPSAYDRLKKETSYAFQGVQPWRRRPFWIKGGQKFIIEPDGQKRFLGATAHVVLIVRPKYKDLGVDPERVRNLVQLTALHAVSDPTLLRMLASFDAAVNYPESVLVHLYEVWEALATRFRKNKRKLGTLGVSKKLRSQLTKMANKDPLSEGRHRGRFAGTLRPATDDELDKAWEIAGLMFESYLKYLKGQTTTHTP